MSVSASPATAIALPWAVYCGLCGRTADVAEGADVAERLCPACGQWATVEDAPARPRRKTRD